MRSHRSGVSVIGDNFKQLTTYIYSHTCTHLGHVGQKKSVVKQRMREEDEKAIPLDGELVRGKGNS